MFVILQTSADMEKCKRIAFWVHWWIPVYRDISQTVLRVCGLSSWFKTKPLTVSTFSSVRALRGMPLPGRLSTVPASRSFFTSLLTPCFVQLFSGHLSVYLFAVYAFKYKHFIKILSSSMHTMLTVDKHCSHVCRDELSVSQIDRKSNQVKEQWHEKIIAISMGKTRYFKTQNIKICGRITKLD